MSLITATRQNYLATKNISDAYCMRIQRRDGLIIRATAHDVDLTMTTQVNKSGSAVALSAPVTYRSLNAYQPTAVNTRAGSVTTIDVEGILDAVLTPGSPVETVVTRTPVSGNSSVGGIDEFISGASLNLATVNSGAYDHQTDSEDSYIYYDFSQSVEFNRVLYRYTSSFSGNTENFLAFDISNDGLNWTNIRPMVNNPGAVASDVSVDLPGNYKSRFFRVRVGPHDISSGGINLIYLTVQKYSTSIPSSAVIRRDIINGLYDFAKVHIFVTDFNNPVEDDGKLFAGYWGRCNLQDGSYTAELSSITDALNTSHGKFVTAKCPAIFGDRGCRIRLSAYTWSASFYPDVGVPDDAASGTVVKPSTQNGFYYKCEAGSGLNGASEPTWPTVLGDTVVDGGVTWTAIYAPQFTTTLGSVTSTRISSITSNYPDDFFANGTIEYLDGDLQGVKAPIKSLTSGVVELKNPTYFVATAGDSVRLTAGCRKRFSEDCDLKFQNKLNHRGYPDLPGTRAVRQLGGSNRV